MTKLITAASTMPAKIPPTLGVKKRCDFAICSAADTYTPTFQPIPSSNITPAETIAAAYPAANPLHVIVVFIVFSSFIFVNYLIILILLPFLGFHRFISKELLTTDTELKAIAAPAIMGLRSHPVIGYNTPAAIGIPALL